MVGYCCCVVFGGYFTVIYFSFHSLSAYPYVHSVNLKVNTKKELPLVGWIKCCWIEAVHLHRFREDVRGIKTNMSENIFANFTLSAMFIYLLVYYSHHKHIPPGLRSLLDLLFWMILYWLQTMYFKIQHTKVPRQPIPCDSTDYHRSKYTKSQIRLHIIWNWKRCETFSHCLTPFSWHLQRLH